MDLTMLKRLIAADNLLSPKQRQELDDDKLKTVLSGAAGGGVMLALSKFARLSQRTQVVLTALGFGVGVLVYRYTKGPKFAKYDESTRSYKIDQTRF